MNSAEVIVYGASGYTGKLISWHLAERGIPFVAAGRNKQRLEEQMSKLPELAKAQYECAQVDHSEAALVELFRGKKVVVNVVGPFMQYGEPVVRAALEAGCHYLDTTGEQDWILHLKKEYGAAFEEKGLLLAPATSWMWTGGQMATELALETAGVDTLDVAYLGDSNTSVASTASFLRMCCSDQKYLSNHQLEVWPHTDAYDVSIPGEHRVYKALPWGGAAEPVWYENDHRVRNCSVLVAFKNQAVANWVIGRISDWFDNYRSLPRQDQEKAFVEWGASLVSEEPARENPDENRSVISCHGRGNTASVNVVLRGNSPYIQTGVMAAEAVRRILIGRLYATGFASACEAFGHRELISAMAEEGYLTWEATQG
ncbi:MAG: DUF5938 domain-containing protein [Amphritea sp.]